MCTEQMLASGDKLSSVRAVLPLTVEQVFRTYIPWVCRLAPVLLNNTADSTRFEEMLP
jgi:hypothetical protein